MIRSERGTMARKQTEVEARGAAFKRAQERCECPGVGCGARSHAVAAAPTRVDTARCSAKVSPSEPDSVLNTRVVLLNPGNDPLDGDSWRVFCDACAETHDAYVRRLGV
jgi:hypothetical protein